ncbi:MAG: CotH kinase family protein [Myxococcota bacterium]|nr:CotH kinase family protein [Myxococcota bacterium]
MINTLIPTFTTASLILAIACSNDSELFPDGDPDGGNDSDPDSDSTVDSDSDSDSETPAPEFLVLYDQAHLPVFELTISAECISALDSEPFQYCSCGFEYRPTQDPGDNVALDNVGIRLKGRASFQPLNQKPGFKVKFDAYIDGQRFMDLRRLTLNNMTQDPSMVRERLGYAVFREMGLEAPLCNHALVYVNGEYYGVYANLQTLDDEFVEWLFDPAPGNLYDTSSEEYFVDLELDWLPWFELETNQDAGDTSDLVNLMNGINGPIASFFQDAGFVLDWEQWLREGAVQAIIADWDGYFGAKNNYKIYHELERDLFLLFPWGIDQTFGIADGAYVHQDYEIDGSTSNRENGIVFERCKEVPECYDLYLEKVSEALTVWESMDLDGDLDFIIDQIEDHVDQDAHKPYSNSQRMASIEDVRDFIENRADSVSAQLP